MILEYKVTDNKFYNLKELLKVYFQMSDNLITKLKKNKRILLNSEFTYLDHILSINDTIKINLDFEEESKNIVPTNMNLDIIFEDEALLIVNKPAGITVHPSINHYENSLSNGIKYYFDSINLKRIIRPVNRLDKDTSGLVIFAKNEYVQELLVKQMKSKKFKKEYLAILTESLEKSSGTIDVPIARKADTIIEREVNSNGDLAITHYEVIKNFTYNNVPLSYVKFILETGRTHQIRVHSKYIGHPILGDTLYGTKSTLVSRQALHAYKITFIHPINKKEMIFEIPLPEDMLRIIK